MFDFRRARCFVLAVSVAALPAAAKATPFAYITNASSNSVTVIDVATETVAATIPVPAMPTGVAVHPNGTYAYVASRLGSTVSVISTATQRVVATIPIAGSPNTLALNPAGTRLYVTDPVANRVHVVDLTSNAIIAAIPVGLDPWGIVVSPDGRAVYVANRSTDHSVSIIDASSNTVVSTIVAFCRPQSLAISLAGDRLWVGDTCGSGSIHAVDIASRSIVHTIPGAGGPSAMTLSPDGARVYATIFASASDTNLLVFDAVTSAGTGAGSVGDFPIGVDVDPAGKRVYVANNGTGTVSIVDATSLLLVATVPVGASPYALGAFIGGAAVSAAPQPVPDLSDVSLFMLAAVVAMVGVGAMKSRVT